MRHCQTYPNMYGCMGSSRKFDMGSRTAAMAAQPLQYAQTREVQCGGDMYASHGTRQASQSIGLVSALLLRCNTRLKKRVVMYATNQRTAFQHRGLLATLKAKALWLHAVVVVHPATAFQQHLCTHRYRSLRVLPPNSMHAYSST
jgi:hypothetical protein